MAIGAYDATPLEMAGAYTVFANSGVKVDPWMLASVRSSTGDVVQDFPQTTKPILDPRVAFLTTDMLENVMDHGTGAGVRAMGFTAPAAGKTGTSHDVWFAGYTSNLLCIVWVGNDDYTDIKLEGAHAAAPIWGAFMKRAVALPQYSDTKSFTPPDGIVEVRLDKATNLLADEACPDSYTAAFLDGTQPTDTCDHANGDQRSVFQKIFGMGQSSATPPPPSESTPAPPQSKAYQQPQSGSSTVATAPATAQPATPVPVKKPGFFGKLFGQKPKPEPQPGAPQQ